MKRIGFICCLLSFALAFASCEKKENHPLPPIPGGGEEKPTPGPTPEPTPGQKGKSRYIWIDAGGNFKDYANNSAKIASDVKRIKETGFTDLVVDVRPTNGTVLFASRQGEPLQKIDAWVNGSYVWLKRTANFDYLQAFIDAARENGLRVNASINTMVGGYLCPYGLGSDGPIFKDAKMKSWASVINTSDGLVNTMDLNDSSTDWGARFFNPANPDAQAYVLGLLADLAKYDLDGIILDRCRYDDYSLQSDFSQESRTQFEAYIGKSVKNWPTDVMKAGQKEFNGWSTTAIQKQWLEFRAKVIHDFVEKAAQTVHEVNPKIRFGAYVGGWYSSYYYSGVNWAHPNYDPKADGYYWAGSAYKNYGYADHCDFMFIGAYAAADSIYGDTEWTMEGFCKQAAGLLKGVPFSGGPDIGNSTGFPDGGQGDKMGDIVNVCINNSTEGMFFFDLCHVKMFDYWKDIKNAFDNYLKTLN